MLIKVSSSIEETELNYIIRFSLPPLYPGGKELGRLRLPLPKKVVSRDCTLFFGRMPLLYPRRIKIVNNVDVYVENTTAFPAPRSGVWKVFIEDSPHWQDEC